MSENNIGARINLRSTNSFESPKRVFICYTEKTLFTITQVTKISFDWNRQSDKKNSTYEGRRERTEIDWNLKAAAQQSDRVGL